MAVEAIAVDENKPIPLAYNISKTDDEMNAPIRIYGIFLIGAFRI